MKKWRTSILDWSIQEIEVLKETDNRVFHKCGDDVYGEFKVSTSVKFHDSFSDAKIYLLQLAKKRVDSNILNLRIAESTYKKIYDTHEK